MPEPRILIVGPALNAAESARSLEMLGCVNLPDATKFVVTTGKFDAAGSAKTFNVETGYPAEPPALQSLAAWAEVPHGFDPRFRDGYDLYCLRSLLAKNDGFDYAVLLRDATGFEERWPDLKAKLEGRLFLTFHPQLATAAASGNVLFDLRDERMPGLLELALDLYLSGAGYALPAYSLESALMTAIEALGLSDEMQVQSGRIETTASSALC